MARPRETISSKRGKERLKRHGDKYVTRYMKLLDKGYQLAMGDDAKFSQVMQVAEEYRGAIEQAFGKPKQEVDLTASVITPDIHAEIARALQQQAFLIRTGNLLTGGNDGQNENQGEEGCSTQTTRDVSEEEDTYGDITETEKEQERNNEEESDICLEC